MYRRSWTEPTAPTVKSSPIRYQRVAHPRLCFTVLTKENDGSTSPTHNWSSCIFRKFSGENWCANRIFKFSPSAFCSCHLRPARFPFWDLLCISIFEVGLKLSWFWQKNIFNTHNLRKREQFYTWCGRRARTGTCLYHNEDIFRSALNFTEPPSSKMTNNHFTVFKYRPRLLIETLQLMLQLKQFKITTNLWLCTYIHVILPDDLWSWGPFTL